MNPTSSTIPLPSITAPHPLQAAMAPPFAVADSLQSRYALRLTARLAEGADALAPDIGERLRFAREQALSRAKAARHGVVEVESYVHLRSGRSALLGASSSGRSSWWTRLAAAVPVVALVGGLIMIQSWQDNAQISVAAEIDAALLSDDLPPTAYSDAGFVEYLKSPGE